MASINKYPWEIQSHWQSRLGFVEAHSDKFDKKRLASLSSAWSNWKFLGCRYPLHVQRLLEHLNSGLSTELQTCGRLNRIDKISFKKSSSNDNSPVGTSGNVIVKGLTIYEPQETVNVNPICILNESCQKSGKILEFQDLGWKQEAGKSFLHMTALVVNGRLIASGTGSCKKSSKHSCAKIALEILRKCQPVLFKTCPNHDEIHQVNKTELIRTSYENSEKLDEDNIGNKMLRRMGWSGVGGLSKSGISDPIFVDGTDGRKGLGHSKDSGGLTSRNVDEMIKKFIRENNETQVKFSNDLTSEERAVIHKMCQKYGLGHKSFGKGEERYLVVTKKLR